MSGRILSVKFTRILAVVMILAAGLVVPMATPANALPAGYFHLQGITRDKKGSLRTIDVQMSDGTIPGFIRLNCCSYHKDSQYWKEVFPRVGRMDVIKLQNKLTGQCLADSASQAPGGLAVATLRPCGDEIALWQKISVPGKGTVFRRTHRMPSPFADTQVCLGKDGRSPEVLLTVVCSGGYTADMIWQANFLWR
ncbi:hypothetical protein [Microtetraspora niveoalba]|uniref:hypothetical protein n=1 Tax=Microtetraspora niveoalba TaxID=46175 RepID=UPI00082F6395|nr:hypothetical protein [Microtetraspora niveoalba]